MSDAPLDADAHALHYSLPNMSIHRGDDPSTLGVRVRGNLSSLSAHPSDGPPVVPESVGAVVVAAGRSRRMGGVDKLWLSAAGRPLLYHSIATLAAVPEIAQIVVVTSPESRPRIEGQRAEWPWSRLSGLVEGGDERADSVFAGLCALAPCGLVAIHDGARPCVTAELIRAGIALAGARGAAIPAVTLTDTIKLVDADGRITGTPERAALRAVQTPQVFRYALLLEAYRAAGADRASCTDDAMIVERLGHPVYVYPGDPRNVKVSTPADIPLVERYLIQMGKGEGCEG